MDQMLAQIEDLQNYLQSDLSSDEQASSQAAYYLQAASGFVRDYCRRDFTSSNSDIAVLSPLPGSPAFVELPGLPVRAVTKVETTLDGGVTWTTMDSTSYSVNRAQGIITARDYSVTVGRVWWPRDAESWRITYDHGYDDVPDAVVGAVVELAANAYATTAGIKTERLDDYSVTYNDSDLSGTARAALARYITPVIR